MNIGDRIPEVLGHDQNGREIKASDYAGRKTLVVPTEAILTSGGVQYVFVVEDGTARYREVVTV